MTTGIDAVTVLQDSLRLRTIWTILQQHFR